MKQYELNDHPASLVDIPSDGVIELDPQDGFTYVMRLDPEFTMGPLAEKLAASDQNLDLNTAKQGLAYAYADFHASLEASIIAGFSAYGPAAIHTFEPDALKQATKQKAGNLPIISLDPLLDGQEADAYPVSRLYDLTGEQAIGPVTRPGYTGTMEQNAAALAMKYNGQPVALAEDDFFTGQSLEYALGVLLAAGVNVAKIIPGIQIGDVSAELLAKGIPIDSVVHYQVTEGNIYDCLDLGDPRDFLVGASGLVVALPDGEFGRLPYVLPFVSASARASIPHEAELAFSTQVLEANLTFYQQAESLCGQPILIKHMDPAFVKAANVMQGFDLEMPMTELVQWSLNQLVVSEHQLNLAEQIEQLNLPKDMVLLDVNGTIFPDESSDGYVDPESVFALKEQVANLKVQGVIVGLCSDSPLSPLIGLATQLGLDSETPIVAENGNIIHYGGQTVAVNPLPSLEEFKMQILAVADGLPQAEDTIAPEFGGHEPNFSDGQWAFGQGRVASVTVFGPVELITELGNLFGNVPGISIDCSPDFNFFAIHSGSDYTKNKGKTLAELVALGHNVTMVGNSKSDWVDPATGVKCAFVGGSRITPQITEQAAYVSSESTLNGVVDILTHIAQAKD